MITLLTTLELATAAHRLRIVPTAARRLELIARAIQAAPERFEAEGLALDGSTALLGVYLASFGVTRVPEALEVAPFRGGGSVDALRSAIAAALDSTVEGDEIVFNALPDPLRPRKAAPEILRLAVRGSRVPLTFPPPLEAAKHPKAAAGAIIAEGLRFRATPTAVAPAAVPVAYFEELVFRLLTRLGAASGPTDLAAQDDFVQLATRMGSETRRAVEEAALPALRQALAARGLAPAEALPLLAARMKAALRSYDPALVAPPGYRVDAPNHPVDASLVAEVATEILHSLEVAR